MQEVHFRLTCVVEKRPCNWTVGEDRGIGARDNGGWEGWERKEWEVGVLLRGREMNKGNYPIMLNILRSKDSSREESSKKDGCRECRVQEAGGLNLLCSNRLLWQLMTLLHVLQEDNLCTLSKVIQVFKRYMYFFYTDPCFHDKHSKKL